MLKLNHKNRFAEKIPLQSRFFDFHFYRTFTKNYRFSTKITWEITGEKIETENTGVAGTRSLKSYTGWPKITKDL